MKVENVFSSVVKDFIEGVQTAVIVAIHAHGYRKTYRTVLGVVDAPRTKAQKEVRP